MRAPAGALAPAIAAALAVSLLGGCGNDRDAAALKIPAAYRPDGFADLALERLRGYRLAPGEEPLAVTYANGALRRFHVVFTSKDGEDPEDPVRVRDRLASGLADQGWARATPAGGTGAERWIKGDEVLTITVVGQRSATQVTVDLASDRQAAP